MENTYKNNQKIFYTQLVKISNIMRLIFGPTIFITPILTTVVIFILDGFDGELYKRAGYDRGQYSTYDKILDYYWYFWIIAYIIFNKTTYWWLFLLLFIYRSIGQFLYLKLKRGIIFFIFPNVFEMLFYYYLVSVAVPQYHLMSPSFVRIILPIFTVIALIREYIIHIRLMNFSGVYLGKTSYWLKVGFNHYKALGFVILMLVFSTLFSMNKLDKTNISFQSQAEKAEQNGKIIFYSPKGQIVGFVPQQQGEKNSSLFDNKLFKNSLCQGKAVFNQEGIFTFNQECLRQLKDGQYYLLLTTKEEPKKSYLIHFSLTKGRLTQ